MRIPYKISYFAETRAGVEVEADLKSRMLRLLKEDEEFRSPWQVT